MVTQPQQSWEVFWKNNVESFLWGERWPWQPPSPALILAPFLLLLSNSLYPSPSPYALLTP